MEASHAPSRVKLMTPEQPERQDATGS